MAELILKPTLEEEKIRNLVRNHIRYIAKKRIEPASQQNMYKITTEYQGKAEGSIHSLDSVKVNSYSIYHYRVEPANQMLYEVFKANTEDWGGKILTRDEAPEWFDFHHIKRNKVKVRYAFNWKEGYNLPAPLGHPHRFFFNKLYSFLSWNMYDIINNKR